MTHTHSLAPRQPSLATFFLSLLLCFLLYLLPPGASAQVQPGTPAFGSFGGGPEVLNLGNNNAHWGIPVLHKAGRGGFNFAYDLGYDTSVWYPVGVSGSQSWQPVGNWGWSGGPGGAGGGLTYNATDYTCQFCNQYTCWYPVGQVQLTNWVYQDVWGARHVFSGTAVINTSGCPSQYGGPNSQGSTSTATDGSGLTLTITGSSNSTTLTSVVTRADGTAVNAPNSYSSGTTSFGTDRNGNQITTDTSGHFYDTLSSTTPVLTVSGSGTPSSPTTFTYTAPSGTSASYTMKYTTYSIRTNYGCSGITEYGANGTTTANLVSEIDLPDGSKYTFSYEATPSHSGFVTGRLASITLPTGGTISYSYSGGSNGIVCADGSVATLTRTTPDGTWTYARAPVSGNHWQTTVTDANSNQTLIDFQKDSATASTNNFFEVQRKSYQGSTSGALLRQWTTCYNGNTTNCATTAVSTPITQRNVNDQYGSSGLQCQHNFYYNSGGGLKEQDDYDYGSGAPGALLRKTLVSYASLPPNITAFQQSVTICNGSGSSSSCAGPSGGNTGTVVAQTNYNYDETTPTATSGIVQHTSVSGSRGNLTSVNYPLTGLTSHSTYYDTGTLNTSSDLNGATTTYNYSSNTADCQMAFPTSISEPLSMSRSMAWNCFGSVMTSLTDENNQVTSTTYSDPYFWRPASTSLPDGGQTSWTYNSETSITTTTKMNSSQNIVSTVLLDGLGRTSQTQLTSDPEGADYSVASYDALGRPYQTYNSTRCSPPTTNCGESSWGYTTTAYDALSRSTSVTLQDGSIFSTSYANNTVTTTDPAGKKRQSTLDALGRLTQVLEDPSGLNYETDYGYDALGNLLCVGQKGTNTGTFSGCGSIPAGWHARSLAYDGMSRLTSETNPETGTITYKYDSDSNCASPNSFSGDIVSRTDARNIRTCYQYDSIHRLTQKNYSDGVTPTAFFSWDGSGRWGVTQTNTTGRLGEEWTGTSCCATGGAEIFSYDAMGRVIYNNQYTVAMGNMVLNYTYDLAGNTVTASNGVGVTLTQSFDTAGRPTGLTSSLNDSNHPGTLAAVDSSVGYYPPGALRKMTFGNGLTQANSVEPRLQPCRINLNSSGSYVTDGCNDGSISGTVQDFFYAFGTWGSTNNENVTIMNAAGNQSFNRAFTYDSLDRLSTMQETNGVAEGCKPASSSSNPYNLTWGYDAWGNRTSQSPNAGTCSFSATVNTLNQLSGSPYQYDAAGNMTNDGNHAYFYDAENRLIQVDGTLGTCSTATACYFYDALGHRVDKQTGSYHLSYLHDVSGNPVTEYCAPCSWGSGWARGHVFFNGQQIAEYVNGTTYFHHKDHLGSTHVLTGVNQSIIQKLDYLPFGELLSGGSGTPTHKFTGMELDSETNLDHTWFRKYSSQVGRWMHPDPAGLAAVNPINPQSWNRYAYVLNNPMALIDPFGLDDQCYDPTGIMCGGMQPPGIYSAAYNGPPPTWQYLQSDNYQIAAVFCEEQTLSTCYNPGPSGSLNVGSGPQSGGQMDIGYWQYVTFDMQEYTSVTDPVMAQLLNAGLSAGSRISFPKDPSTSCGAMAKQVMAPWLKALQAWLKAHPGQPPPPDIATPPSLPACAI